MNKCLQRLSLYGVLTAILIAGIAAAANCYAQKKAAGGEEFFIVASVDLVKSELLLKRASEVTVLMRVSDKTQIADSTGKTAKLADLRAGDTVWVVSSDGDVPTVLHIRKGQMTVADLHRYYLDYPEIK